MSVQKKATAMNGRRPNKKREYSSSDETSDSETESDSFEATSSEESTLTESSTSDDTDSGTVTGTDSESTARNKDSGVYSEEETASGNCDECGEDKCCNGEDSD